MNEKSKCRFCSGNNVPAEYTIGDGFKTMGMMIGMLSGMFGNEDEPERLYNGIQLQSGNMLCFDNSAREYVPLGIRIGNCPFCGRELKPEEEE